MCELPCGIGNNTSEELVECEEALLLLGNLLRGPLDMFYTMQQCYSLEIDWTAM